MEPILVFFVKSWGFETIFTGPLCSISQLSSVESSLSLDLLLLRANFLLMQYQQQQVRIFFRTLWVNITNKMALTAPCPESPIPCYNIKINALNRAHHS